MADTKPFKSLTIYDQVSLFPDGINSDVNPLLLPRTTLAWSKNASVRGGYVKQRPPFINQTLTFASTDVESGFLSGKYQGGGYYRPDFGLQQLIAQIGGRLFTFTPNVTGFDVAEVTIPGDPNDPNVTQVWMNQAEKWMIISDGTTANLIFYDGVTSRRSNGPSVQLALVSAVSDSTPVVGQTIQFTLTAPWTRPYGETVLFNGEFWQTIGGSATPSYDAILTNLSAKPGGTVPDGSNIVVKPNNVGTITAVSSTPPGGAPPQRFVTITLTSIAGLQVGMQVNIPGWSSGGVGEIFVVNLITPPNSFRVRTPLMSDPAIGTLVTIVADQGPDTVVGITDGPFTVPAQGADVTVTLEAPYSGPDGQSVWIGTDQYTIRSAGGSAPTSSLFMKSISAVTAIPAMPPNLPILSVPELPPGRMGAYGLNHQTMSLLDGTSFIYGDTNGWPSGSATYSYRDAVLKTTENTFQQGGGAFRIPNTGELITSMRFAAVLDAAYGQGPLQIGTAVSIFTCAVPQDRATWVLLENPILTETLIGRGPLGQNSTIPVNSDTFFRTTDGLGSMIFGRRDFVTWGNTGISAEVSRVTSEDNRELLSYGSSVTFDNRFLGDASPEVSSKGIIHPTLLDMNFDPVSSLRGKAPSIWESQWLGLNVLQVINGLFSSNDRCFAFTYNSTLNKIEIHEIMPELLQGQTGNTYDNNTTPITWEFETASLFNRDVKPLDQRVSLREAEISLGNVQGALTVAAYWRPDESKVWQLWHQFTLADDPANPVRYYPRLGLGQPSPATCLPLVNQPARDGYYFQVRLVIVGTATFFGGRFSAVTVPEPPFAPPVCSAT